jgi:thiol-disulfide isomerase/thioredoxin
MKKNLLFFSLINTGLIFTACVEKSIIKDTNIQSIIPIVTTAAPAIVQVPTPTSLPIPIQTPTRSVVVAPSTAGEAHQLRTVQGSFLTVQERSNGFVFPQYQDKVVLLQIFGQDCPYCFKEMPIINRVKRKYASNLQIIAIQAQDDMSKETASRLIQNYHMNYPVVDKNEATNLLHFMQTTYGWTGVLPYMLLIKNGVTEYSFAGEVSHQELDEAVKSLI